MRINKTKTKIMVCDRNEQYRSYLTANNNTLEDVKECTRLGSRFTKNKRSKEEIKMKAA